MDVFSAMRRKYAIEPHQVLDQSTLVISEF